MLLQIFWFQIPLGYALIWIGTLMLGIYIGFKITIVILNHLNHNSGSHH